MVLMVGVLLPTSQSRRTHSRPPSPTGAAATELIANDTPRQQPVESAPLRRHVRSEPRQLPRKSRSQCCSMFSRRIVAARPLARSIVPVAARPRPQFTQVRTALTDAEKANLELSDPNQVRFPLLPGPEARDMEPRMLI